MLTVSSRRSLAPTSRVGWLSFCLGVATWFAAGCSPSGPESLLRGERAVREGRFAQAIVDLRRATAQLPRFAPAWNHLGLAYHHAGQAPAALSAYRQALELDAKLAAARYNLGCLLLEQGQPEAAVAELTTFTILQPQVASGWLALGAAQYQLRQPALAAPALQQALRLDPNLPEAWNLLGAIAWQRNRPADALSHFAAAQKCQTNYGPALLNQAIVLQQHYRNPSLALQKYRQYLQLSPAELHSAAVQELIASLGQEAPPQSARTSSLASPEASSLPPADTRLANLRTRTNSPGLDPVSPRTNEVPTPLRPGVGTRQTGRGPATVKPPAPSASPGSIASTNALPERPSTRRQVGALASAKTNASSLRVEKATASEAMKSSPGAPPTPTPTTPSPAVSGPERAPLPSAPGAAPTTNPPPSPVATVPPSTASLETNPPVEARPTEVPSRVVPSSAPVPSASPSPQEPPAGSVAPAAARSVPGVATYPFRSPPAPAAGDRAEANRWLTEGLRLQQNGEWQPAVVAYRKSVAADPSFLEGRCSLALAAQRSGALPEALLEYEWALAIDPDSFVARYNFGLALQKANYPRDAADQWERLLKTRPTDTRLHLLLGNVYAYQLRQPALARAHYRQVVETDPRHEQAPAIRAWLAEHP